jgi:putative inorganic carbon (HCO3(-)) transporter
MIDWIWVGTSSLWITGLALILAAVSWGDCRRRGARLPLKRAWRAILGDDWSRAGALLVCGGMALGRGGWPERALWIALGLDVAWRWRVARRAARPSGAAPSRAWRRPRRAAIARRGAEWIIRAESFLLAAAAPLFLFPSPRRSAVLLLLPVLALARLVARRRALPRTPLDWPIVILLAMVGVSAWATFDLAFSLGKIVGLLYGLAVFWAVTEWAATRRRLAWSLAAYAAAGGALAGIALVGTRWGTKFAPLAAIARRLPQRLVRLPGAEDGFNPNQVGGALLWVVPPLLAIAGWAWTARIPGGWRRWGLRLGTLGALGVTGGTLLLSQSRSAQLGLAAALCLLAGLAAARAAWLRPVLVVAIVAGAVVIAVAGPARLAGRLLPGGGAAGVEAGLDSLASRREIWSRGLYGLQDFPFTGMGMNNFRRVAPILYPFFTIPPTTDIAHAHNQFLQAGLDLGIPGLIGYLALWLLAAALALGALRRAAGWERALAAGIAAALLAAFIFGLADAVALGAKPGVLFWWLLAMLVALWRGNTSPILGGRGWARVRSVGPIDPVARPGDAGAGALAGATDEATRPHEESTIA